MEKFSFMFSFIFIGTVSVGITLVHYNNVVVSLLGKLAGRGWVGGSIVIIRHDRWGDKKVSLQRMVAGP